MLYLKAICLPQTVHLSRDSDDSALSNAGERKTDLSKRSLSTSCCWNLRVAAVYEVMSASSAMPMASMQDPIGKENSLSHLELLSFKICTAEEIRIWRFLSGRGLRGVRAHPKVVFKRNTAIELMLLTISSGRSAGAKNTLKKIHTRSYVWSLRSFELSLGTNHKTLSERDAAHQLVQP